MIDDEEISKRIQKAILGDKGSVFLKYFKMHLEEKEARIAEIYKEGWFEFILRNSAKDCYIKFTEHIDIAQFSTSKYEQLKIVVNKGRYDLTPENLTKVLDFIQFVIENSKVDINAKEMHGCLLSVMYTPDIFALFLKLGANYKRKVEVSQDRDGKKIKQDLQEFMEDYLKGMEHEYIQKSLNTLIEFKTVIKDKKMLDKEIPKKVNVKLSSYSVRKL